MTVLQMPTMDVWNLVSHSPASGARSQYYGEIDVLDVTPMELQ